MHFFLRETWKMLGNLTWFSNAFFGYLKVKARWPEKIRHAEKEKISPASFPCRNLTYRKLDDVKRGANPYASVIPHQQIFLQHFTRQQRNSLRLE